MLTIDSQVHAYERNHPRRPWTDAIHGPPEMTGDQMVAAMDAAGVDGALLVSPFATYRYDASYALEVRAAHPTRFGLVKPVNPNDPAVEEDIADWAGRDGCVGVRLMPLPDDADANAGVARVLTAAGRHGLPVALFCREMLDKVDRLAAKHPDVQLVIDHCGLRQALEPPAPAEPFKDLPALLKLAAHDNIALKISGACTYSHEPYPFRDLWAPIGRIFDAFGLDRCMWGADWTRSLAFLSYQQNVDAFREVFPLSDSDRAALMGETLRRIYRWSPS